MSTIFVIFSTDIFGFTNNFQYCSAVCKSAIFVILLWVFDTPPRLWMYLRLKFKELVWFLDFRLHTARYKLRSRKTFIHRSGPPFICIYTPPRLWMNLCLRFEEFTGYCMNIILRHHTDYSYVALS